MVGVIYTRVSSKEQLQNMSLPTQRRACVEYCERHGIEVAEVFVEEGESAKTMDRPVLQQLLAYCREHRGRVDHVIVYAINRLARKHYDHAVIAALLQKLGITLRSVTEPINETSIGQLMEGILASFSQFDNDVRAERTIEGMRAALRDGRWTFGPPIGYRRVFEGGAHATIAPDPERAPLVRRAFELMATGRHTKREVLAEVTRQGLVTARNAAVSPQTFQQILRNPIYAGWLMVPKWGDDRYRGDFEALVDEALFERVQAVLDGRRVRLTPYARNHPDFPLRCFARCGRCNTPVTGSWSRGRSKRYAYYRCRKRGCGAVNVPTRELERRFVAFMDGLAPNDQYLALFEQVVLQVWKNRQVDAAAAGCRLEQQVADLRAKKTQLVEAGVYKKLLDEQTFREQMDGLNERLALAELALHDARLDEIDTEGLVAFAKTILAQPSRFWIEASLDQRQRLQRLLFPAGVIYEDGRVRTDETSLIYRMLRLVEDANETEVSPTGFEPVLSA
jgi:DNA invertase Pin-like site-specific DNA recombinase